MTVEKIPIRNRGDWLALRRGDLTASDMGALFGVHPYRSALQVFADKTGLGVDRGDSDQMRRGRLMEGAAGIAVQEERPDWHITKAEHYYRDPDDRIGATPDFLIEERATGRRGVLETKSAELEVFERDWAKGAPLAWSLQTLTQMMLLDASFGAVAVLVMTRKLPLFIYHVPRHDAAEAKIRAQAKRFWDWVDHDTPPPIDFSRDAEVVAAMFPNVQSPSLDLTGNNHIRELLEERAVLSAELGERGDRKQAIDTEIKAILRDAEGATLPGWKISWRERAGYTATVKPSRVLRVTDLRQKESLP